MAERDFKIGNRLLKARREQKIHISVAAKDLCIPLNYLKAFEKDDTTALPEPIYAVGFMRTYADYLGLNPDPFVETLKANYYAPEKKSYDGMIAPKEATTLGLVLFFALIGGLGFFGLKTVAEPSYTVEGEDDIPAHVATLLDEEDQTETATETSE